MTEKSNLGDRSKLKMHEMIWGIILCHGKFVSTGTKYSENRFYHELANIDEFEHETDELVANRKVISGNETSHLWKQRMTRNIGLWITWDRSMRP